METLLTLLRAYVLICLVVQIVGTISFRTNETIRTEAKKALQQKNYNLWGIIIASGVEFVLFWFLFAGTAIQIPVLVIKAILVYTAAQAREEFKS